MAAVCLGDLIFPAGQDVLCERGRVRARSVFPYCEFVEAFVPNA